MWLPGGPGPVAVLRRCYGAWSLRRRVLAPVLRREQLVEGVAAALGALTTYAYRNDTVEVVAVWDTGNGACSARVTRVAVFDKHVSVAPRARPPGSGPVAAGAHGPEPAGAACSSPSCLLEEAGHRVGRVLHAIGKAGRVSRRARVRSQTGD